jgi:DNA modification methylase
LYRGGTLGHEPTVDAYAHAVATLMHHTRRVLRDDGLVFLVVGDCYVSKRLQLAPARVAMAMQAAGWILRADLVWAKPNPVPESVKDRPTLSHEHVLMLSKRSRYFWNEAAAREPAEWDRWGQQTNLKYRPNGDKNPTERASFIAERSKAWADAQPKDRNLRSVLTIPTESLPDDHTAPFPEALVEILIACSTPDPHGLEESALVLDPMCGSGTTCVVARRMGRRAIGIDLNAEFCEIARRRLRQPTLWSTPV